MDEAHEDLRTVLLSDNDGRALGAAEYRRLDRLCVIHSQQRELV